MGEQLDLFACEELGRAVRKEAGLDGDRLEPAALIARKVLGAGAVREVPRFSTPGVLVRLGDAFRIFVRRGERDANFIVAHELGHWAIRRFTSAAGDAHEEDWANWIGAAIVAPAEAVRSAYAVHADNVRRLAPIFDATQSMVWLRLGEVLKDERALLAGDHVRIRSAGRFPWYEPAVKLWGHIRPPRGVKKTRLRTGYDAGRVAFRAA